MSTTTGTRVAIGHLPGLLWLCCACEKRLVHGCGAGEQQELVDVHILSNIAVALYRYLTERAGVVPLGLHARLMAPADVPLLLMALLDEPPWERRSEKGIIHRFEGGVWQPSDRLRLGQIAVQVI